MGSKVKVRLGNSFWRLWSASAISNLGDGISAVAYPWLASSVTRSPLLIALIGFASRVPWLLFTLFAGVLSDRFNRKRILIAMDLFRGALTVGVAIAVTLTASSLPQLSELNEISSSTTNWSLYSILLIASIFFGMAEVLRDNTAQTFMPLLVEKEKLEKANGRLWSAESLTNTFIGPPIGSFLVAIAIFLPFWIDAASFFIAAAVIASSAGSFAPTNEGKSEKINFKAEIKVGFAWLWNHQLFRTLAIVLGCMNFTSSLVGATFILFAQEVLHTSVQVFAILGTAGAIGGLIGSTFGHRVSAKLGSGPALRLALISAPLFNLAIAFTSSWQILWVLTVFEMFIAVLWNLITVSLRQSTIPTELFGRVNSVYRFFAWGSIPLGVLAGGIIVKVATEFISRESALRLNYLVGSAFGFLIFLSASHLLTTSKIEAVKGAK
jgi:MFS family permease